VAYAVRIWPIDIDTSVTPRNWGQLHGGGALGSEAPWRFEPSYWKADAIRAKGVRDETVTYDYCYYLDLSRDEVVALDQGFREGCLSWQKAQVVEMDRALDAASGFRRFRIYAYEWEGG
jgi:hypothetical protein